MELDRVARELMRRSRCAGAGDPVVALIQQRGSTWSPLAEGRPRSTSSTVVPERGVPPREGKGVASLRAVTEAVQGCLAAPASFPGLAELAARLGEAAPQVLTAVAMCAVWGVTWPEATRLRSLCKAADEKLQDFAVLLDEGAYQSLLADAWARVRGTAAAAAAEVGDALSHAFV